MAESEAVDKYSITPLPFPGKGCHAPTRGLLHQSDDDIRADILSMQDIGRATLRYRSKMTGVVAHARAPGLALRLAVALDGGWHRGPRSSLALGLHAGEHCSGGLQRHCAPARPFVQKALKPQHFSGGSSRASGRAVGRRGVAPAAFQFRRSLANGVAAICAPALNFCLALAKAASDNKSLDTDEQVHPCAPRTRLSSAGQLQR